MGVSYGEINVSTFNQDLTEKFRCHACSGVFRDSIVKEQREVQAATVPSQKPWDGCLGISPMGRIFSYFPKYPSIFER